MSKTKPKIKKFSEVGGTGRFCLHQIMLGLFIHKKKNPVGRCEDIKNAVFDMVPQGKTELFTNFLKFF